jgi:hypothetical protein
MAEEVNQKAAWIRVLSVRGGVPEVQTRRDAPGDVEFVVASRWPSTEELHPFLLPWDSAETRP